MTDVYWTPEARARLEDIEAYIAKDAPSTAKDVVARLLARARQLTTAPLSGRQVPDYPRQGLRELLERPYRIILSNYHRTHRDPHGDALPSVATPQSERITELWARNALGCSLTTCPWKRVHLTLTPWSCLGPLSRHPVVRTMLAHTGGRPDVRQECCC